MADAQAVASALQELARLIAATDSPSHRALAYERAAGTVRSLGSSLEAVARDGRLLGVPGIGKSITGVILELMTTGHAKTLDDLRALFGPCMRELGGIAGLTPIRIQTLYRELGIASVSALRAACEAEAIRTLRGFGAKTELKLLASLTAASDDSAKSMLLVHAREIAERLRAHAVGCPDVCRADVVGAVRRWEESVSLIDILATVRDLQKVPGVFAAFERAPDVLRCEPGGANLLRLYLRDRFVANLWAVHDAQHGFSMIQLTGSPAHVARLDLPADPWLDCDEATVYQRVGLPYIPPKLREDQGEIEASRAGDTFADLDLFRRQGVDRANGNDITITDHSPAAHYAGGLTGESLAKQWRDIADAQSERALAILRGTESDILAGWAS